MWIQIRLLLFLEASYTVLKLDISGFNVVRVNNPQCFLEKLENKSEICSYLSEPILYGP